MNSSMDPYQQQWFARLAAITSGMNLEAAWTTYSEIGGTRDRLDFQAYLHGLLQLESFQRDMVSHALNEILDESHSSVRRAAYTTDIISLASGTPGESSFESTTDAALNRLLASAEPHLGINHAESLRLSSLDRTALMGSAPEGRFDRITRRARAVFGVSSASIALIGEHCQFIKSVSGPIGVNVPREISFCDQTIRTNQAMVVLDAQTDKKFMTNPLVLQKPHIRFYAGYALRGPGNWPIGTLCIIDDRPRGFTRADLVTLKGLAAEAQYQVDCTRS